MRKKRSGVLTEYFAEGKMFASHILCVTEEDAEILAKKRGLNEVVISQISMIEPPEDYQNITRKEFMDRLPEIIHSVCFWSFIAFKSGNHSIDAILGDCGVLHELCHLQGGKTVQSIPAIKRKMRILKDAAIGHF